MGYVHSVIKRREMPLSALQGVRVIETATDIAGPYCAKLLADYGAEVIKVERPGTGDPSRLRGPFPDDVSHPEKSGLFLHLNTNKKGVTLDLESSRGRDLFKLLLQESHILVESGRPGRMDSLGLGYDVLRELRPELVMTSVTPFGQTGPDSQYEFTELTVFATGGGMHREGLPDREPLSYGGEIAQYYAGSAAAGVTMAACLSSWLEGHGRWIDISIQECMAGHPHQIGFRAPFTYAGVADSRKDPHAPTATGVGSAGAGTFKVADGYVSFLPLGARMWPNLAEMIERPDLVADPRFRTPEDRAEHDGELTPIIQGWFDSHTRAEVFAAAQEAGLPGAPVLTVDEVMEDEHFADRGYFVDIVHPDAGTLTYPGLPFRLSDATLETPSHAPRLGQHNDEVFCGLLGLEGADLPELTSKGVI